MGSDNGSSLRRSRITDWVIRKCFIYRLQSILAGALAFLLLLLYTNTLSIPRVLPAPELVHAETFTYQENFALLPQHCRKTAEKFHRCQESSIHRVVFGCHRRWCNGSGYCEPCSGLGDRNRFLFSQLQKAVENCWRIELDYPITDVSTLDSVVYKDPSGWLGELLRYRSYDVSARTIYDFAKPTSTSPSTLFSHFTPKTYPLFNYDGCYYHILFQPSPSLKLELDRYNVALGNRSIGIHYRTGDSFAFGMQNLGDFRVKTVWEGWLKMMKCSQQLAQKLYPDNPEEVTFYLATDNAELKKRIQEEQRKSESTAFRKIYMTDEQPRSFVRGLSGERVAYLEAYLLSQRQGMVANVLVNEKDYHGTGGRLSQFVLFAKKIGFLEDDHVLECSME